MTSGPENALTIGGDQKTKGIPLVYCFIIFIVGGVCAHRLALWCARLGNEPLQEDGGVQPPLVFVRDSLRFAPAWESSALRHELVLENQGKYPVHILSLDCGCNCTRIEKKELIVEPGQKVAVPVSINLSFILDREQVVHSTDVAIGIRVFAQSGRRHFELTNQLRGLGKRGILCNPDRILSLEEITEGMESQTYEAAVHCDIPGAQLRLIQVPQGWSAAFESPKDDRRNWLLTAKAFKGKSGEFNDRFLLQATNSQGDILTTRGFPIMGRVAEAVEVLPRCLELGSRSANTESHGVFTIIGRNGSQIQSLSIVASDSKAKTTIRKSHSDWRVEVWVPTGESGDGTCTFVAQAKFADGKSYSAPFTLRWHVLSSLALETMPDRPSDLTKMSPEGP